VSETNYNLIQKRSYADCILATHASDIYGPPDYLIRYLIDRTNHLIVFKYPLSVGDQNKPGYKIYINGAMVEEKKSSFILKPFILNYIKDIFLTIYYSMFLTRKYKLKINIFFGCNNLLTIAGIFISKLIKVNKVIFYSIDYSNKRFENKLLNRFYLLIDKISVIKSNFIWSNTNRTRGVRESQGAKKQNNILVPNGVTLSDIPKEINLDKKEILIKERIINIEYHGYLAESKGIQNVILALEKLNKDNFTLSIIGYGPFEVNLKDLVKKSKYNDKIHFLGKKTNKDILSTLASYDLCINLINLKEDYLRYCDPMKIKEALACKVPVLISNVPEIAERIKKDNWGLVIEDSENIDEISIALGKILNKPALLKTFKNNLNKVKEELDWNFIYDNALKN